MLLAIDIGNTNINCAIFRGVGIVRKFVIQTKDYSLRKIKRFLGKLEVQDSIICSVVPAVTLLIRRDLAGLLNKPPHIIGKDIKVPIKNLYRNPQQVGQDRLVNAYAGAVYYGSPLIVVDFGTAVTFDVVSKKKEYLGGMIVPGLNISLDSLADKTALLPKIKLGHPKEFIGRDTANSMLSGIVYGFAALSDDLVARIKTEIGRTASVIGTGGNINLIGKYCKSIDKIDRDLTLKGLHIIYKDKICAK